MSITSTLLHDTLTGLDTQIRAGLEAIETVAATAAARKAVVNVKDTRRGPVVALAFPHGTGVMTVIDTCAAVEAALRDARAAGTVPAVFDITRSVAR